MKLATLRKTASALSVALAFGSMAHTGELPLVAIALFAAAFVAALAFGPRIARGRAAILAFATFGLLAVIAGGWFAGTYDFVVAAALFAAAVSANRMLGRQSAADDGLLYLAALMMLAGGAALSGDISYALHFCGFTLTATFALTLSHLERAAEESKAAPSEVQRLVAGKLLAALGGLSMLALVGAIVIFFVFPRFTTGFLGPVLGHRHAATGFSGELRLGGYGALRDDPRVVAHIKFEPDPQAAQLELRWRGKTFDRFDGHSWSSVGLLQDAPTRRLRLSGARGSSTHVEVEILPEGGSPAVFVPEGAIEATAPHRIPARRLASTLFFQRDSLDNVTLQPPPEMGYGYELQVASPGSAQAVAAAELPEDARRRYVELPEHLDPRVRELAAQWTQGLTEPLQKARALERRLLTTYQYTTELPGETSDPLASFLFERRAGHCEFFASAMTILARASGLPARNASGYYGGRRTDDGSYVLRAGDAHAWTEVYLSGRGFVAFDATPPSARGSIGSGWSERWADLMDSLQSAWLRLVIDYSFREQLEGVSSAAQVAGGLVSRLHGPGASGRTILGLVAALLAIAVVRVLWRRARKDSAVRSSARTPQARKALEIYRAMLRRLKRRGVVKRAGQTPRELVAQLQRAKHPRFEIAHLVTERYLAARFGERALKPAEIKRLRRAIRGL